ncbi:MAG: ComEC/Rec2 family competence protein [Saprospiraceae bacterium]
MFNWRPYPFIRLLLPFIIGILLANQGAHLLPQYSWALPPLLLLTWSFDFWQKKRRSSLGFSLTIHLFLIVFGSWITLQHNEQNQAQHFQNFLNEENLIQVQITAMPIVEDRIKLRTTVLKIGKHLADLKTSNGNLWLYLDHKIPSQSLRYGDQLLIKTKLLPIPPPQNPKAFDYGHFMHLKNIHYQAFVAAHAWQISTPSQGNSLLATAYNLREHFLKVLKKHLITEQEFAVGAALILGYKAAITDELSAAYASTGAMHVLAVSGLHVGLFYLILSFLLNLIPWSHRYFRWFKMLFLLSSIFGFALLTGASASVLRAATLFSFIIVGKSFEREASIYNSLAASAFILLLMNPYLLWEVGFQLSYAAVLGIVYFQEKIYPLWYIENAFGDYVWKLTSVAIAAQLTTFPLSFYYFHQFPIFFFLSGLVVVPAAVFILSGGLLLFLTEAIAPFLATGVAYLLYGIIWLTNACIFLLEQLPGGLITGIWISFGVLVLLYGILLISALAIYARKPKWVIVALTGCLMLFVQQIYQKIQVGRQRKMVCYQVYRNSMIDFIDGNHCISFANQDLALPKQTFAAQNFRWSQGIAKTTSFIFEEHDQELPQLLYQKPYLQFYDQRILLIDHTFKMTELLAIPVDYLYLRNNPKLKLHQLRQQLEFKQVIFDASNYSSRIAAWKEECQALGIPCFNLQAQGAFLLDLQTKKIQ